MIPAQHPTQEQQKNLQKNSTPITQSDLVDLHLTSMSSIIKNMEIMAKSFARTAKNMEKMAKAVEASSSPGRYSTVVAASTGETTVKMYEQCNKPTAAIKHSQDRKNHIPLRAHHSSTKKD